MINVSAVSYSSFGGAAEGHGASSAQVSWIPPEAGPWMLVGLDLEPAPLFGEARYFWTARGSLGVTGLAKRQ